MGSLEHGKVAGTANTGGMWKVQTSMGNIFK